MLLCVILKGGTNAAHTQSVLVPQRSVHGDVGSNLLLAATSRLASSVASLNAVTSGRLGGTIMTDLIFQLILLQVAVPLIVIALNAIVPAASLTGLILRTVAILMLLQYSAMAGIWLFPPWWTPYVLMGLHMLLSVWLWRQLRRRSPAKILWMITETGVSLIAVVGAIFLALPAYQVRGAPDVVIDLAMPLGPGRYLVISGGATPAINAHFYTLDRASTVGFRGQSYAVDIIGINQFGLRAPGISPTDPAKYAIYGRDVVAPCAGTVLATIDGVPDNEVPEMNCDDMTGNSVILECDGLAVVLAHFIPGSLNVSEGDQITTGQQIALVGNSGNSGEPHLHVHVQTIASSETPISGEPLWFTLNSDLPFRNSRFVVKD